MDPMVTLRFMTSMTTDTVGYTGGNPLGFHSEGPLLQYTPRGGTWNVSRFGCAALGLLDFDAALRSAHKNTRFSIPYQSLMEGSVNARLEWCGPSSCTIRG
jgi:hypothetical protein